MSADPCTFCGGTGRMADDSEACPPCDGTGFRRVRRALPSDIGCKLLTPDQQRAILMRLDALDTGLDQHDALLTDARHKEGCKCNRCLARWMNAQMRATLREIRGLVTS